MAARLASQSAARKLAQVVGVLMLPILALTAFYFMQAREDIDHLTREMRGVELAGLALPVLLEEFRTRDAASLARAAELETELGLPEDMRLAAVMPDAARASLAEQDNRYAGYMHAVGQYSGVVFDAEAESSFIAATVFLNLPDVVRTHGVMHGALDAVSSPVSADSAISRVGAVGESFQRFERSMLAAISASDAPQGYENLRALSAQLGVAVQKLQAAAEGDVPETEKIGALAQLARGHAGIHQSARAISAASLLKLKLRLQTRSESLWRTQLATSMGGLACMLVGVVLAVALFRSTLVKLDSVETARVEADAARKEAEQMAQQLTVINGDISRLNQELASNMQQLKAAQDGLIKKGRMEQIGQLTATIAHEIRNPLGAVRTSAFLLERRLAGKGLNVEGQIQRINNGVTRCDQIISQLLDLSRTKQIEATVADLDDWLAKTVRQEAGRLPHMVYIECMLGLDGAQVPFDAARLERAVANLLNNACEAMVGTGDEPSKFATQHPRISVSSHLDGDYVALRVTDNGPGIAPEHLERIREPLFTTKSFGTGLGIPAIEQIAIQHGGRLEISSAVGKGATFTIYLPRKPAAQAA